MLMHTVAGTMPFDVAVENDLQLFVPRSPALIIAVDL